MPTEKPRYCCESCGRKIVFDKLKSYPFIIVDYKSSAYKISVSLCSSCAEDHHKKIAQLKNAINKIL